MSGTLLNASDVTPSHSSSLTPGRWRRASPDAGSSSSVLAGIFGLSDLHHLSASQQTQVNRLLGNHWQEVLSLAGENNSEIFHEGLLQLGQRLEGENRIEAASAVYSALTAGSGATVPGPIRNRAQARMDAITGSGPGAPRAEFLLRRLSHEAMEPTALVGMGVASAAFRMTRLASLSRLAATPTANFMTRGFGARATSSLLAFGVEASVFPMATRLGNAALGREQEWSWNQLSRELAGSFIVLGALKLAGWGSMAAFNRAHGINPLNAQATRLSGLSRITQSVLPQASMLAGIYGGHQLETAVGLRPHVDGATTWVDSLALLVQFNVAGRLTHGLFGPGFQRMERAMDLHAETLARSNPRPRGGASGIFDFDFGHGLAVEGVPSPALRLPGLGVARPAGPLAGPQIMMMENGSSNGSLTPRTSAPPASSSAPLTVPPASNRSRLGFDHPLLIMEGDGAKPIHVDVTSDAPIAEDAPARVQAALQNLLRRSEADAEFRLSGPVAELLRRADSVAEGFRPSADRAKGLWFQITPEGFLRQAISFADKEPRRVLLSHEAQITYGGPVSPLAYDLLLPGRSGGNLQSSLHQMTPEGLREVMGWNFHEGRKNGNSTYEINRLSTAGLKVRLIPLKQQHALEIRDRRENIMTSISAERIIESPAQRLMALFELRRRADTDDLRLHSRQEIDELVAQISSLPREHALRERFLQEIGEETRSVIADLLELMSDLQRPVAQRLLLGEAMARREIVGSSRRHRILSYDIVKTMFPLLPGDVAGPPPSLVRFVESMPAGDLMNRLMVRSWAPSAFDYIRPLEEAVGQLQVALADHPESRDNVLQMVVERPHTISSDDVFSDHLLASIRETVGRRGEELAMKRITFVVHRPGGYPDYFTFRRELDAQGVRNGNWAEDRVHRHLHPMLAHFIELSRLDAFDLDPDHRFSDRDIHLFYARNDNQRLFASSLVPEAQVRRSLNGELESISEVEDAFVRLATAMQNSLEARSENKPNWNRMFLNIQPLLALSDQEVAAYAETLAVRHRDLLRGLGLEKVVVKGRLRDERTPTGARPILVRISNPTGYQFEPVLHNIVRGVVRTQAGEVQNREILIRNGVYEQWLADPTRIIESNEWAPADIPIRPATPAEIREQRARSRGATWAYRIPSLIRQVAEDFRIRFGLGQPRMLGSEPPVEAPHTSFWTELELDPGTTRMDPRTNMIDYNVGELVPALGPDGQARPIGENQAGVVIGIQSDHLGGAVPAFRRVLIMGDLTHASKGSLSANECARINAAIRLAAREGIPVDWYTASSGAEIHETRGVEGLDATASTVREIVLNAHSLGVPINVIVNDVNIGAQSYWNSLATIIHNTGGVLIMTGRGSMALTGPDAWTVAMLRDLHSEDLPARSAGFYPDGLQSLAGYRDIHGPNLEAMGYARDIHEATELLLRHHYYSYAEPHREGFTILGSGPARGIVGKRLFGAEDPDARDITVFSSGRNGRTVSQEIADIMSGRAGSREAILESLRDQGSPPFLRWWADGQGIRHQPGGNGLMPQRFGSLIGEMQIGGRPTLVIFPPVGPLTPADSEVIARAIWKANARMPVLLIGSLSGFNGDPRSMENRQLFAGASIAEAIVNHRGPISVVDMGYIVGGAFVVVSKQLNPSLRFLALEGAHAQVIGGPSAAKVVFRGAIRRQADRDPRVVAATEQLQQTLELMKTDFSRVLESFLKNAPEEAQRPVTVAAELARTEPSAEHRQNLESELRTALRRSILDPVRRTVISEIEIARAADFDRVHNIPHAVEVGAIDEEITPSRLRERIIFHQEEGIREYLDREAGLREAERGRRDDELVAQDPEIQIQRLTDSLLRVYHEENARDIAATVAEGLSRFARGEDSGSGTPPENGSGAPP